MPNYRIRNVTTDYYLSSQDSTFISGKKKYSGPLPVIRVFGITESGQKCCAHIHGTFPCIWIRTNSPLSSSRKPQFSSALTHRLQNQKFRPTPHPTLIDLKEKEARSMYGYYDNKTNFTQLLLRDPIHIQMLAKSFQSDALHDENLQPYQAHIPFLLQFFIEYAIFGMDFIEFSTVYFRKNPKNFQGHNNSPLSPSSNVAVEFDAHVDDILNPQNEAQCEFVNSGLSYVWEDERERRKKAGRPEPKVKRDDPRPKFVSEMEKTYLRRLKMKFGKVFDSQKRPKSANMSILNESSSQPQNGEMNKKNEDSDEYESDRVSFSSSSSSSDAEDFTEASEESTKTMKKFVGWECKTLKPQAAPISRALVEKEGEEVTFRESRKTQNFHGTVGDITIHSRIFKEVARKSVSPQKKVQKALSLSTVNHLCVMSIELVCESRSNEIVPNPMQDPISILAVSVVNDICNWRSKDKFTEEVVFAFTMNDVGRREENVVWVKSEYELLDRFCKVVQKYDPDILIGYDLHRESWTYLTQRCAFIQFPINRLISRIKTVSQNQKDNEVDKGRISLEVWKVIRKDSPMRNYELGYVTVQLLQKSFPVISFKQMQGLLKETDIHANLIAIRHTLKKANLNIELLEVIDIFVKTSQMARVYGIQFTEVLSRGSQFRVESMLIRLVKRRGFMAPSVGVEQRNLMGSPETIPLNLEPQSGIYRDPVVVLDFQSLYPSVCIAYNYCFTTCLGRINRLEEFDDSDDTMKLGALHYSPIEASQIKEMIKQDLIHVSPTGGVFVKEEVRRGLLGEMLEELLDSRVIVKESMKTCKGDVHLRRMLDAQQLALKLVANTTYGYTAANWSGRMPCEEVADAIVAKGREALERTIQHIHNNQERFKGARVIYGDTDSVFVLFKGCSRSEAFELGNKIADEVTEQNPPPMKLKFEKVMQPCVLLTKKRYVGMSYEKEGDEGEFDAKGIETVRRDGSPFVSKMVEKCLRILFDHNPQTVIQFLRHRLTNLDSFPLSDFVINAEFRDGYSERAQIPAKKLANERRLLCERFYPTRGERLSYVIVKPTSDKKNKLIDCIMSWQQFQQTKSVQLHFDYYVGKHLLSALSRFFDLVPVKLRVRPIFYNYCKGCYKRGHFNGYCNQCDKDLVVLHSRISEANIMERRLIQAKQHCKRCLEVICSDPFMLSCYNYQCQENQLRIRCERGAVDMLLGLKKQKNFLKW